jgi:D-alanyl-D-alanine carboxypeptidase/D-alanyl-D-alanine-endopeptidase (penicillin-binding protein 4)
VRAKTGTLRGVSCYAGFVKRGGRWEPFSLLINQAVPYGFRLQVADGLASAPDLGRLCPGASC